MKDNYYNHIFITKYVHHTTGTQTPQRTHLNLYSRYIWPSSHSLFLPQSLSPLPPNDCSLTSYMKRLFLFNILHPGL